MGGCGRATWGRRPSVSTQEKQAGSTGATSIAQRPCSLRDLPPTDPTAVALHALSRTRALSQRQLHAPGRGLTTTPPCVSRAQGTRLGRQRGRPETLGTPGTRNTAQRPRMVTTYASDSESRALPGQVESCWLPPGHSKAVRGGQAPPAPTAGPAASTCPCAVSTAHPLAPPRTLPS